MAAPTAGETFHRLNGVAHFAQGLEIDAPDQPGFGLNHQAQLHANVEEKGGGEIQRHGFAAGTQQLPQVVLYLPGSLADIFQTGPDGQQDDIGPLLETGDFGLQPIGRSLSRAAAGAPTKA